ncbi:MAG: BtpA/SgcQ family protein [Beutenbergiaceae bacterium]
MTWLNDMFGVTKPIIAMLHLHALPGDPNFDSAAGMQRVIDDARRELDALQGGGVDAVMISNEFSLPYLTKTEPITAISMARIIGELREEIRIPFGVNVLWDGIASIDLAAATGAQFVREIFTGVYASDFGLWNTNVGESARHRRRIGASDVRLLFNIVPEATGYLAARDLGSIARSTVFNALPDALLVSGLTAGAPADNSALATVKENAGDVPVLVNTGMTAESAATQLSIADGAVVGTALKADGKFANRADQSRVERLMEAVREARQSS